MEDVIFERDYQTDTSHSSPSSSKQYELLKNSMRSYHKLLSTIPRVIDPVQKANFEYAVQLCDTYAQEHHGKLKVHIDFHQYEADIMLILPFFEFQTYYEQDLEFLKVLAETSYVLFRPNDNGQIELTISFNYFKKLCPDLENLQADFFANDPDFLKILEEDLSDPEDP